MTTVFQLRVDGSEHLPADGAFLLAGNHTGWLDAPALMVACDFPIRFMVAERVLQWPVIGALVKQFPILPVTPGKERRCLRATLDRLAQGDRVCIFPEGKLSETGRVESFQGGVGYLQRKSGVPVVPFAIHGGYEAWPWGRWLPRRHPIAITFGPPILMDAVEGDTVALLYQRVCTMKALMENAQKNQSTPKTAHPRSQGRIFHASACQSHLSP
jgi:1-acyl-sn-glycerol-3-phosphate acyltransferase